MNVTAIIVTRGDVDLTQILESIPEEWEKIVWDNGAATVDLYNGPWARKYGPGITKESWPASDLAVYGRYAAIEHASGNLIYVQDDDVLHKPEGIRHMVQTWVERCPGLTIGWHEIGTNTPWHGVVCNMPANFRHAFYQEHALVGFGAVFHPSAPARAFSRFMEHQGRVRHATSVKVSAWEMDDVFLRTCDIVFTGLTERYLVDVLYEDMPWASADNRMWRQPTHREERGHMLELVKEVRDARA